MAELYPLPFNEQFVFFYNIVAATLWFCCFARFLILLPLVGRRFLPGGIADFFHVVALLPLIGSIVVKFALKRAWKRSYLWSLLNGIKMAWLCYGVIFPHPRIARHTSYSILISAWCVQYIIHYSYFAFKVKTKRSPLFLLWLEYNNFYFTYPFALAAEMILLFLSLGFVEEDLVYDYAIRVVFLSYIPVAYFAWSHLQKRKQVKYTDVIKKRNAALARNAQQGGAESSTTATSVELRDLQTN
ncbi:Very-long-chain (3R)-3-hydroxyacyl-CoA dehydratase PASTICCINO 2 [Candida viswanathii]|uniref:Very-long-chain (3R)-3-hydroxyacyl-CoA dehydratase n=1 Tax=Candida viswanathii TaxID=5486 RepID=A0A367XZZ7_9ASCO|nr:Very-long-chain (3R)-3-hydroxyacyl-CoA dehydratase PASTICCINO 2 [Candida viswanathii]